MRLDITCVHLCSTWIHSSHSRSWSRFLVQLDGATCPRLRQVPQCTTATGPVVLVNGHTVLQGRVDWGRSHLYHTCRNTRLSMKMTPFPCTTYTCRVNGHTIRDIHSLIINHLIYYIVYNLFHSTSVKPHQLLLEMYVFDFSSVDYPFSIAQVYRLYCVHLLY